MSPGLTEILTFLSDYFESGKSYSTVNVPRSMLSTTLGLAGSTLDIGKSPLVSKLLKGMYNIKPPVPRCVHLGSIGSSLLSRLASRSKLFDPTIGPEHSHVAGSHFSIKMC